MGLREEVKLKAGTMVLKHVHGRIHVLISVIGRSKELFPNYMGTGMALSGVLRKDEDFADYKERWIDSHVRIGTMVLKDVGRGVESYSDYCDRWKRRKVL